MRGIVDLEEYVVLLRSNLAGGATTKQISMWLQSVGVNNFLGAMHRFPHFNPFVGSFPFDLMHVLFEGITRELLGVLVCVMCTEWGQNIYEILAAGKRYLKHRKLPANTFPYVNDTRTC